MKTYQYRGTVRTAAGRRLLFPDQEVQLDEKDEHVKSLVGQKLLIEVKKKDAETPSDEPSKKTKK